MLWIFELLRVLVRLRRDVSSWGLVLFELCLKPFVQTPGILRV